MDIFMKILLEFAADLAFGEKGHHLGGLGRFVEADHFFVEFLPLRGRDADDVLAGFQEEAIHQESASAFVAVPEALGAGDEEKDGHGLLEKVVDFGTGIGHLLEGIAEIGAFGWHVGGAGNGNFARAEDAFFQGFASGGEGLEFEGDFRGASEGTLLDHLEECEEGVFLVQDLLGFADFAPTDGDAVEEGLDFRNGKGVAFHHGDVVDDLRKDFLGPPDRAAGVRGGEGGKGNFSRIPYETEGFKNGGRVAHGKLNSSLPKSGCLSPGLTLK